ncbi:MAG: hypothetical protein R3E82_17245 [Pseudomonadales bacterium]
MNEMDFASPLIFLLGSLAASLIIVGMVLRAARGQGWLVEPNARSSHRVPTPTAGGLGIVIPTLAALLIMALDGHAAAGTLAAGGAVLAAVGLWDDFRDLGVWFRLAAQACAVFLILSVLVADWGVPWLFLAAFLVLWNVNLFNFMDGIDGIAAGQVLLYSTGLIVLGGVHSAWPAVLVYVLIGSSLGFLAYNWSPSKIFMGDVSSGFLGVMTASLAIMLHQADSLPIACSFILLAGFWCDATWTLVVRILTRQRFIDAHRSHLYQRLAGMLGHRWTTVIFLIHGLLWLLPNALLVLLYPHLTVLWVLLSTLPVCVCCWTYRAGFVEKAE